MSMETLRHGREVMGKGEVVKEIGEGLELNVMMGELLGETVDSVHLEIFGVWIPQMDRSR